jgi:hypothetical protein
MILCKILYRKYTILNKDKVISHFHFSLDNKKYIYEKFCYLKFLNILNVTYIKINLLFNSYRHGYSYDTILAKQTSMRCLIERLVLVPVSVPVYGTGLRAEAEVAVEKAEVAFLVVSSTDHPILFL